MWPCWFKQYLRPANTLTPEGCSGTGAIGRSSKNFQNNEAIMLMLFSKCVHFYVDLENPIKISGNFNGFEKSCILDC